MEIVGSIVAGGSDRLIIREKKGANLELGELVVIEDFNKKYIYMVSSIEYGSIIGENRLYTSAGTIVEDTNPKLEFPEDDLRFFRKVTLIPLLEVYENTYRTPRSIPNFLSKVRRIEKSDFSFLKIPENKIFLGKIRNGSKVLDLDYYMNGEEILSHHVLIAAQTGRGKSNLVKVMLWEIMNYGNFGILVLDVHNEYFGYGCLKGLKDHPKANKALVYYSKNPPPGQKKLIVNLKSISQEDLFGIIELSEPQKDAISIYVREYGNNWLKELLRETQENDILFEKKKIHPSTLKALRRKLGNLFRIKILENGEPHCEDEVFCFEGVGETIISDMANALEEGKIVIIDGSTIPDETGLIIMSAVMREVFNRYEKYKNEGKLKEKVQIGVVLEEAPRILGELYDKNIFGRIAREGRKFKIGLIAVTQMASVIPDEILANIGTKIIMGNEMQKERMKLIENSPQNLSDYNYIIAGLEKGESIVTSIFSKFPVPIYTPLFDNIVNKESNKTELVFF
ncbi:MAG: ATP-binding protein [Candidatus Methanomethylicaceae archaeon]|nr:ATP-binding protein [Candidatus Verstraetearchaeota archaeon]